MITRKHDPYGAAGQYTAQIYPFNGKVYAEIIVTDSDLRYKIGDGYMTIADNSFGSMWRKSPCEQDYVQAKKWVEEQLEMIRKHASVLVCQPKFIADRIERNR